MAPAAGEKRAEARRPDTDPLELAQGLFEKRFKELQELFKEFLEERTRPFLRSVLYDLEYADSYKDAE